MNFDNDAAGLAFGLMFVVVAVGFWLVISAIQVGLAYAVLSRVPVEHRKQSLGLVFLLFIPLFSLIWMFFVHPKIAESMKSYFGAKGGHDEGRLRLQSGALVVYFERFGLASVGGHVGEYRSLGSIYNVLCEGFFTEC